MNPLYIDPAYLAKMARYWQRFFLRSSNYWPTWLIFSIYACFKASEKRHTFFLPFLTSTLFRPIKTRKNNYRRQYPATLAPHLVNNNIFYLKTHLSVIERPQLKQALLFIAVLCVGSYWRKLLTEGSTLLALGNVLSGSIVEPVTTLPGT